MGRKALKLLPLFRIVNAFSQGAYMRLVNKVLKLGGVQITDSPLWIAPSVNIDLAASGMVRFGQGCVISERVTILTHDYSMDRIRAYRGVQDHMELFRKDGVAIGDYAFVGMGAILMPGVIVGRGSIIAAGSVVTQSVKENTVVGGNPARELSTTDDYWVRSRSKFELKERRR